MRIVKWVLIGLVLLLLVGLIGGGWYYSDVLREDGLLAPEPEAATYDLEVVEVGSETILLPRNDETQKDGVWGLEWENGYAQVGRVVEVRQDGVLRELRPIDGLPAPGTSVALDGYAFSGDPSSVGSPFRQVAVVGELGNLPAWKIDGDSSTWAIFVHGRGAELRESLRTLPVMSELGLQSLVISYRNDPGAPSTEDRLLRFGQTEWRDVEAAVRYAQAQGATQVVLVGYSMGGAIATTFLFESGAASLVRGAVLDAPVLDFGSTVTWEADRRGIPRVLTNLAKAISSARFGISWSATDLVARAEELQVPVLVFHGQDDASVPIETSQEFSHARPELVTLVSVPHAGHVESWNVDPLQYEASVREFVKRVTE